MRGIRISGRQLEEMLNNLKLIKISIERIDEMNVCPSKMGTPANPIETWAIIKAHCGAIKETDLPQLAAALKPKEVSDAPLN